MTSALYSDFAIILERSMKSSLNVKEIRLQWFSICLDRMQPKIYQVMLPQQQRGISQQELSFENAWHADSERLTAEGNLQLVANHQITKAVVQRANECTENDLVRLCGIVDYAEILRIGEFLQTRPSRNSTGILSIPCGEVDRPTGVEGGQVLRKICPGSKIGPIEEINIFSH